MANIHFITLNNLKVKNVKLREEEGIFNIVKKYKQNINSVEL